MILYGVFAETSITQVFVGGIGIGLVTAVSYCAVILLISLFRPDVVPPRIDAPETGTTRSAVLNVLPILALIVLVFGGLFAEFFSATEAGAVGALGTIVISAVTGRLTREVVSQSLLETVTTTGSLFIIAVGAAMFTRFLGLSGLSGFINSWVAGADLTYVQLMLIVVLIYLALGTFMEPVGAMLVTLPVFLPVLQSQGLSLVWFGVLVVKLLEIGMITPPVGLNVFVIKNVAYKYVTTAQIFAGVIPFLLADLVVVILTIAFPAAVLFLPGLL
nr:TRAP transporter large permease subunit [Mameliella alba]